MDAKVSKGWGAAWWPWGTLRCRGELSAWYGLAVLAVLEGRARRLGEVQAQNGRFVLVDQA